MLRETAIFQSVQDVAAFMGCHEQTVRKLIKTGQIPAIRVGARLKIDPADLFAFVKRQRIEPGGGQSLTETLVPAFSRRVVNAMSPIAKEIAQMLQAAGYIRVIEDDAPPERGGSR